jgi:hypothetical protein
VNFRDCAPRSRYLGRPAAAPRSLGTGERDAALLRGAATCTTRCGGATASGSDDHDHAALVMSSRTSRAALDAASIR